MQRFCCLVWVSADEFGDSPLLTKVKQFNSQMQNSQTLAYIKVRLQNKEGFKADGIFW